MDDMDRFVKLLSAGCACVSIVTHEEKEALGVVRVASLETRRRMLIWSVGCGVREGVLEDSTAEPETDQVSTGLFRFAEADDGTLCVALDLASHLNSELHRRMVRELIERFEQTGSTLVMIDSDEVLPGIIRSYTKTFEISLPDEKELDEIVRRTIRTYHRKKPVEVGITVQGMRAILKNLKGLTRRQARQLITEVIADDQRFDDEDVNRVMAGKRKLMKEESLLEFVRTPLDIDQIGGMDNLKKWLRLRSRTFTAEAREFGIKAPRGILLLGVQGAGKSLCAKAIATAWQQPLLRLEAGKLYDSYIGQSEKNLRTALRQAEFMAPVILWIDEIEKAFASAASQSSDGGLSKRMFGSLLTWMQEHEKPVFLVATANDIEALPPELLRKGRFDEIFFVGLPKLKARKQIFEIHLNKRKRDAKKFDLDEFSAASEGFSGAEIEQAIVSALHHAFADKKELISRMILDALKSSPPLSVTMREKIESLCQWAKGRCVSAD